MILPYAQIKCPAFYYIDGAAGDLLLLVLLLFQSTEFYATCADRGYRGIPQVWGAIDCTHVRITKPKDSGAQFVDRKSDYSVVMQAVCDANGIFQLRA